LAQGQQKISLRAAQGLVYQDRTRFRVLVTGRRFGKTYWIVTELVTAAAKTPGGNFFYCAPTYRMAKDIAWDMFKALTPAPWLKKKPNETELKLTLVNGATIELKGVDNPDTLVGRSLDGVALDECALYPDEKVWTLSLRPALADKRGWAIFATTIRRGFKAVWFLEIYEKAMQGRASWKAWTFTTLQGENVSEEEIEAAKADMDEKTFRQEFLAELQDEDGRVAITFSNENITEAAEDDENLDLLVGIDFNVDPFCAALAVKKSFTGENGETWEELHIFDEIHLRDATTWDMGEVINDRFDGSRRRIFGYPDPTGNARRTNAAGGTDHTILRQCGITVIVPKAPYKIRDKIAAVNTGWKNAKGERRAKIHPRCKNIIKSMRLLMYDEDTGLPDKTQGLDHDYDTVGYLFLGCFNLARPEALGNSGVQIYGDVDSRRRPSKLGRFTLGSR
jgi:hypothetical protein